MKKLVALVLLLACSIAMFAEKINLNRNYHGYEIITNNSDLLELDYSVSDLVTEDVQTEKGMFTKLFIPQGQQTRKVGEPALPTFNNLIEMPYGSNPVAKVISYDVKEYKASELGFNYTVYPAQPSYTKNTKPEDIKFIYNEDVYNKKGFTGQELVKIVKQGSMRGVDVATVVVNPVHYDPANGIVKVYENIKVEINYNSTEAFSKKNSEYSPFFDGVFSTFINHKDNKNDLVNYPVTYLLVANEYLQGNEKLQEFIEWKTEKGFNVVDHYVSSTASVSEIDSWIEEQYNSMAVKPSFVLLVGDMDGAFAVATDDPGGSPQATDSQYGVINPLTLENHLPSMYVGRFSVRTLDDLAAQVDKTIWYEKGQFLDTSFDKSYLGRAMGTAGADAGNQASHGNPHIRYQNEYFYSNSEYRYPVYNEDPELTGIAYLDGGTGQASNIVANVSEGVAIYNYTAHGGEDQFVDPYFGISDVNSLTNQGKYGMIIGNCCVTGTFNNPECFGEAWLNAPDKGAIAFLGSSMNTVWDEDLAMGVGRPDSGNALPAYSPEDPGMIDAVMNMQNPTSAGIRVAGLLAVDRMNSELIMDYWNAYNLMGDPSVMIYVGVPTANNVSYDVLNIAASEYVINAAPGSLVALSAGGELKVSGIANESGVATLVPSEPITATDGKLVVTAQFKEPHIEDITFLPLVGPYLSVQGDLATEAVYGEASSISLDLKNVGVETSEDITLTISSENEKITFSDNSETSENIAADATVTLTDAFAYTLSNDFTDQEKIAVTITINDSYTKQEYITNKMITVNAPKTDFTVSVSGEGMPNPGDTRDLTYTVTNNGHADLANLSFALTETTGASVTITGTPSIAALAAGASAEVSFTAAFDAAMATGTSTLFNLAMTADKDYSDTFANSITVGITESFDGGDFTSGNFWQFAGNADWTVVEGGADSSPYAAKSGSIGAGQKTAMTLTSQFDSDGKITFFKKVSCEPIGWGLYDGLIFYIDGEETASWAGEVAWSQEEFNISAGLHTFTWEYIKDGSGDEGEDCAWVDNIITYGGNAPADNAAPAVVEIEGNSVFPGTEMTFKALVEDQTGIASVQAHIMINDIDEVLPMTLVESKDKARSWYQITIPAQDVVSTGTIDIITEDTVEHISEAGTYLYNIKWEKSVKEGFEGTWPPIDWTVINDAEGNGWRKGIEAAAGEGCASASYTHDGPVYLISPEYILENGMAELSFMWKDDDISIPSKKDKIREGKIAGHDTTFVEISADGGDNWTELGFLSAEENEEEYHKFTAPLADYYSEGGSIILRWRDVVDGSWSAWGVGIDELFISNATVKPDEEAPLVEAVENTSVVLNQPLVLTVTVKDQHGLAEITPVKGMYNIGSDVEVAFEAVVKKHFVKNKNGEKVYQYYTFSNENDPIAAQAAVTTGTVKFMVVDEFGNGDGVWSDNYEISWYEDNTAPVVTITSDLMAKPDEDLIVTALANDETGIASLSLNYAVNGGITTEIAMEEVNGVYSAAIPGQANGSTANVWIKAIDTVGNESTTDEVIAAWVMMTAYDFENQIDFVLDLNDYWRQIDVDKTPTYSIQNVTFPNQNYKGSFIAFNPTATEPALSDQESWLAHSGDKYLACFASMPDSGTTNNDWLVSPDLTFDANGVFSFFAKSITDQYGLEKFNVYVAPYENWQDTGAYTKISNGAAVQAPVTWTQFSYDMSAYAGQKVVVAIQCVSEDAFALFIDDVKVTSGTVGINNNDLTALEWKLEQNYPNPFNPATSINFSVKEAGMVKLAVFNSNGQLVKNLVNNSMKAGHYNVKFNAENLNSGVYFYQLRAGAKVMTKKMILVK